MSPGSGAPGVSRSRANDAEYWPGALVGLGPCWHSLFRKARRLPRPLRFPEILARPLPGNRAVQVHASRTHSGPLVRRAFHVAASPAWGPCSVSRGSGVRVPQRPLQELGRIAALVRSYATNDLSSSLELPVPCGSPRLHDGCGRPMPGRRPPASDPDGTPRRGLSPGRDLRRFPRLRRRRHPRRGSRHRTLRHSQSTRRGCRHLPQGPRPSIAWLPPIRWCSSGGLTRGLSSIRPTDGPTQA